MKTKSTNSLDFQPEIRADREEFIEYLGNSPDAATLDLIGLTPLLWKKISTGKRPLISKAIYKMARFHRYGCLKDVLGREYGGFFVSKTGLTVPGLKYELTPSDMRSLWFDLQIVPIIKANLERSNDLANLYKSLLAMQATTNSEQPETV